MSNITDAEIEALKKSRSDSEWDEACDEIKAAHGGKYPDDWHQVVILGKLAPDQTIEITSLKNHE